MTIHLQPWHLQIVTETLKRHNVLEFASAFGSRVQGANQEYSDLDILIKSPRPLTFQQISKLEEAFSSSDLPFKVDLVDWHTISNDFRDKILSHSIPLGLPIK